jgi:uncharacterized protein VirK/YbjX
MKLAHLKSAVGFWAHADRLCRILHASRSPLERVWRQLRWYALALLTPRSSSRWFEQLAASDMRRFAAQHPQLAVKPLRPYLSRRWSVDRRSRVILHTHQLAEESPLWREALLRPHGVRLLHGSLTGDTPFEVRLGRDQRFRKEGELVLSLRTDWQGPALCSVALAIERQDDGTRVCYLGSVQGREGAGEELKAFAKSCFGMRAHALLLHVVRQLAAHMGAQTLLGASNDIQVHRQKHLIHLPALHKLHLDYDQLWLESGGWLDADGWFRLPLQAARRERAEIPARKRAQYERRYQLLDRLGVDLQMQLESFPLSRVA